ncbi:MAG: hypothetical protein K8S16_18705, partial [Bacteroidales bacterium]|nr:hypothetical protein [Bacteroidales bacterium]
MKTKEQPNLKPEEQVENSKTDRKKSKDESVKKTVKKKASKKIIKKDNPPAPDLTPGTKDEKVIIQADVESKTNEEKPPEKIAEAPSEEPEAETPVSKVEEAEVADVKDN